jgi:hypothetical protein
MSKLDSLVSCLLLRLSRPCTDEEMQIWLVFSERLEDVKFDCGYRYTQKKKDRPEGSTGHFRLKTYTFPERIRDPGRFVDYAHRQRRRSTRTKIFHPRVVWRS